MVGFSGKTCLVICNTTGASSSILNQETFLRRELPTEPSPLLCWLSVMVAPEAPRDLRGGDSSILSVGHVHSSEDKQQSRRSVTAEIAGSAPVGTAKVEFVSYPRL